MVNDLLRRGRALWNPDMYHGWGKDSNYFEGWYFKVVAPHGAAALAFIPGIAHDANGKSEAFVQVLDGLACKAYFFPFPADAFRPSAKDFSLELGDCFFSSERVEINLPG